MATTSSLTSFRRSLSPVPMTGFWVDTVPSLPKAGAFTAGHHALIALVSLAVVVYASLFPFAFQGVPLSQAMAKFQAGLVRHAISRSDFIANVLLFIPLGYFLLGALRADRHPRSGSLGAMAAVLAIGAVISVGVEFGQAFFPLRTPDGNDMLAQFLGTCIGVGVWECFGRNITGRVRQAWESRNLRGQAGFLLFAYVAALVFLHLLPFDLDCRPNVLVRKCSVGISRAFAAQGGESRYLWNLIYFLPAGLLAAYLTQRAGRSNREWRSCLVMGLKVVIAVKAAQLLVRSQRLDLVEIVVGLTGFAFGWFQGRVLRRRASAGVAGVTSPGAIMFCVLLGVAWYAAVGRLLHGQSVDFTDSPVLLLERMQTMNWWPLLDIYSRDYLLALRGLMQQALLFLAAGALVAMALPRLLTRSYALPTAVVVAVTALVLEVGTVTGPQHNPSVTAILCETAGAMVGFLLLRGLLTSSTTANLPRKDAMAPVSSERPRETVFPATTSRQQPAMFQTA